MARQIHQWVLASAVSPPRRMGVKAWRCRSSARSSMSACKVPPRSEMARGQVAANDSADRTSPPCGRRALAPAGPWPAWLRRAGPSWRGSGSNMERLVAVYPPTWGALLLPGLAFTTLRLADSFHRAPSRWWNAILAPKGAIECRVGFVARLLRDAGDVQRRGSEHARSERKAPPSEVVHRGLTDVVRESLCEDRAHEDRDAAVHAGPRAVRERRHFPRPCDARLRGERQ